MTHPKYVVVSTPNDPNDLVQQMPVPQSTPEYREWAAYYQQHASVAFDEKTWLKWTGTGEDEEDDKMLPNGDAFHRALTHMVEIRVLNPEVGDDRALIALYATLAHVEGRLFITRRLLDATDDDAVRAAIQDEIAMLGPATGRVYGGMYYEQARDLMRRLVILTDMKAKPTAFNHVLNQAGWMRAGVKAPHMRLSHETEDTAPSPGRMDIVTDIVSILYPSQSDLILQEKQENNFKE